MKTKIISVIAACMFAMLTPAAFAQTIVPSSNTQKALSFFDRQFGSAVTPAIQSTPKGGLVLHGEADSRVETSVFNKKGKWIYSIVRYPSVNLDKYVMLAVQHNADLAGYHITGMEKVDQPGRETVYIVHLKNSASYKTLQVSQHDVEAFQAEQNA